MIYISLNYYILVLVALVLYYLFPVGKRWVVLLVSNIAFYYFFCKTGWGIFSCTIIVSYLAGLLIQKTSGKPKKIIWIISLIAVILPWLLVKNTNFIITSILNRDPIEWIVPLGISFYTLQIVSYVTDIFNNKIGAQRNIFKYILFISFFPQIIQGPIPRYNQLQEKLIQGHIFDEKGFVKGFCYVIWGFFLKLVIADKAGIIVNTVFDNYPAYSGGYIWLASFLYSIQLYADFLACTTLAQGVARMFGIELTNNFARPYFATSIKDFWRRWHISLSEWLRDYIYIPLGGNKKGNFRKNINLLVTFLISGLWHGGAYHFIVWGCIHAFYQIIGTITYNFRESIYYRLHIPEDSKMKKIIKQIVTFSLVSFAWIIFRAETLMVGVSMIKHMIIDVNPWIFFNNRIYTLGLEWKEMFVLAFAVCILLIVGRYHEGGKSVSEVIINKPLLIRWAIMMVAIIAIVVFGTYGTGFNAQDFIYGGF